MKFLKNRSVLSNRHPTRTRDNTPAKYPFHLSVSVCRVPVFCAVAIISLDCVFRFVCVRAWGEREISCVCVYIGNAILLQRINVQLSIIIDFGSFVIIDYFIRKASLIRLVVVATIAGLVIIGSYYLALVISDYTLVRVSVYLCVCVIVIDFVIVLLLLLLLLIFMCTQYWFMCFGVVDRLPGCVRFCRYRCRERGGIYRDSHVIKKNRSFYFLSMICNNCNFGIKKTDVDFWLVFRLGWDLCVCGYEMAYLDSDIVGIVAGGNVIAFIPADECRSDKIYCVCVCFIHGGIWN